jgi:hypothetical protein
MTTYYPGLAPISSKVFAVKETGISLTPPPKPYIKEKIVY